MFRWKDKSVLRNFVFLSSRLLIAAVISYFLFLIGKSVWQSYETTKVIDELKAGIVQIESDNEGLGDLLVYYETNSFQELEARRRLGLKGAGEKVISVTRPEVESEDSMLTPNKLNADTAPSQPTAPNPVKWWNYVIGG